MVAVLLEPRSSASPRGAPTDPKSQPGAAARRADGLRGWNQEFNNNYRPEGKSLANSTRLIVV
ncbi:hypothetical protein ANCDUO_09340 [Ancylostoma duodenale]|uniref:Uncharacterized protein n=1 Tax=Ancylostoma duodenale TaxID=51022 RepID=A0A0C2CU49_9BILA|nr:hypothetical protein ANCDUO_09340 [Ancylostoma duodenale]